MRNLECESVLSVAMSPRRGAGSLNQYVIVTPRITILVGVGFKPTLSLLGEVKPDLGHGRIMTTWYENADNFAIRRGRRRV